MTSEDLYKDRYKIVFDALAVGLTVEYKMGWQLFYQNKELFQTFYSSNLGKQITHKSGLLLSDFMVFIDELPLEKIKRFYGDTRLIKLQNRLTGNDE